MFQELRSETAQFLSDFFSTQFCAWFDNELRKGLNSKVDQSAEAEVQSKIDAVRAASSQVSLLRVLEKPKKIEHGHLAFPLFALAKILRMPPPKLASEAATLLKTHSGSKSAQSLGLIDVQPAGGFLNLTFSDSSLQSRLFAAIDKAEISGGKLGWSQRGLGKKVVIDYSSPNVAKPMHVGHLRATVVGQAIRNLAETQGYEVIGLNHLGDWGVQFGKLAWAFLEWGKEYDFKDRAFQSLFELYVRFNDEAEKSPEIESQGAKTFLRLEAGDPKIEAIWKMFVDITLKEDQKLWDLLGVKHDLVLGESFYNSRLKSVEKLLEDKGLLEESEGAWVVKFGDEMAPCLIRKSDGASLYATRDLASAIYRKEDLKADLNLYVVGFEQSLHFKQVFRVLEMCGMEWAKDCHHIAFGLYRFKEGMKMSTRKGQVVFLEDVLKQAIERTSEVIATKNPAMEAGMRAKIAEQVGVGAVIFGDLLFDRSKNVEFDWDRILSFEGDSGPYVQYMHVRCASLIRKYKEERGQTPRLDGAFVSNMRSLSTADERELVRVLLSYDDVLESSFDGFRPNVLAQYLLDVCTLFSRFYHNNRILGEAKEVEESRMALVAATQKVLKRGLAVLSMQAPEYM